jgi:hypothetical protein
MLMDFLKGLLKSGQGEPSTNTTNTTESPASESQNEPWPGFPLWPNPNSTESAATQKKEQNWIDSLFARRTPGEKPQETSREGILQRKRVSQPNTQINPALPGRGPQASRLNPNQNRYQNPNRNSYQNPYQNSYQNRLGQPVNPFAMQKPPFGRPMERPMLPPPFAYPRMQRFNGLRAQTQIQSQGQAQGRNRRPLQTFSNPGQSQLYGYPPQYRMPNRFTHPGIHDSFGSVVRPPARQFEGPWL